MRTTMTFLPIAALLALTSACGDDSPSAHAGQHDQPSAALTAPVDGARVAGAVDVVMSATGITIAPAGDVAPGTGHFHVIADQGCLSPGSAIGKDADHVHFGTGASAGTIYLEPGSHSLCLQVGDGAHVALPATDSVTIDVGVDSVDEFCDVIAQVDALLTALDTSADAWPAQQTSFENIRRLLAQIADGTEHVDADARDDVAELVRWATVMAETMVAAESKDAGMAQVWGPDSVLPQDVDLSGGEAWVLDACGISIA